MTHHLTDFTFDERAHICRDANGILIPSVTQILKLTGHAVDLTQFQPQELLDRKSAIGKQVHWLTDIYDQHGEVDSAWLTPDVEGYYRSWVKLASSGAFKVIATSVRRVAIVNGCRFTGELDKQVRFANGQRGILDLKCSDAKPKSWEYQTGGYEVMETGKVALDPRRVRAVARLFEDGRQGKLVYHEAQDDGFVFLSALHTVSVRLRDKTLKESDFS